MSDFHKNFGELMAENIELKEQVTQTKTVCDVFMYYICDHTKQFKFTEAELVNLHMTYSDVINHICRNK